MAYDSQDGSQETDRRIDFQESRFLDLNPESEQQQGVEPEGESRKTHDPNPPSRLILNLEESQASEAAPWREYTKVTRHRGHAGRCRDYLEQLERMQLGRFLLREVIEGDLVSLIRA